MLVSKLAFAALVLALPMALGAHPRRHGGNVAVVFPPWTASAEAVRRATVGGGTLVRLGRQPFIVIIRPGAGGSVARAAPAGAWFVMDASGTRGCSPSGGPRA